MWRRVRPELFIRVNWKGLGALEDVDEIWIIFFMTSDQRFDEWVPQSSD